MESYNWLWLLKVIIIINQIEREITDHVAIVTGSSSGIGFEIALMYERHESWVL